MAEVRRSVFLGYSDALRVGLLAQLVDALLATDQVTIGAGDPGWDAAIRSVQSPLCILRRIQIECLLVPGERDAQLCGEFLNSSSGFWMGAWAGPENALLCEDASGSSVNQVAF